MLRLWVLKEELSPCRATLRGPSLCSGLQQGGLQWALIQALLELYRPLESIFHYQLLSKKHYSALLRNKKKNTFLKTKNIFRIALIARINIDEVSCNYRVWFLFMSHCRFNQRQDKFFIESWKWYQNHKKRKKKKSKVLCTTLQLLKTSDSGYLMVVITSCHNKQVATLLLYFTLTFGWNADPAIWHQPVLGAFPLVPTESSRRLSPVFW